MLKISNLSLHSGPKIRAESDFFNIHGENILQDIYPPNMSSHTSKVWEIQNYKSFL
jgi:hypothetical protein